MRLPEAVIIREVGPRDGLQNEKVLLTLQQKMNLVERLIKAGLKNVEATSFVSHRAVPQHRDAEDLLKGLEGIAGDVVISGLVANERGLARALGAGIKEVVVVVSASEAHNHANVNMTVEQSLSMLRVLCQTAVQGGVQVRGAVATAFGCPFSGQVRQSEVEKVVSVMTEAGIGEISLADTAGLGDPRLVYNLTSNLYSSYRRVRWGLHMHDTRGLGAANMLAGLQAGITVFETSAGGIGGCPCIPGAAGNVATEEFIYMLDHMGVGSGVSLAGVMECTGYLEDILGRTLPARVRPGK